MAERQQEYVGSIKKCPSCGQVLQSFQAKCPSCGHELSGIEVVGSVSEFFNTFQKETDKVRQLELIKMFPIPNSREDILEFALLASQQIKSFANAKASRVNMQSAWTEALGYDVQGGVLGQIKRGFVGDKDEDVKSEDFLIAWKDKLEQVHLKAELAFGDDKKGFEYLEKIVSEAIEAVDNLERKKKKALRNYIIMIPVAIVILIAVFTLMPTAMDKAIDSQAAQMEMNDPDKKETARLENLMAEIQSDISSGNYDSAELKLSDLRWKYMIGNKYYQADIDSWDNKRNLLQKQIDSKRNEL